MKWQQMCLGVLALNVTAASAIVAGNDGGFDLSWHTVDGGGGTSTGGAFEISGSIGQHDAVGSMTGGSFKLSGGFWAGGAVPVPTCPADIAPQPSGNGMVNIDDLVVVITSWGAGGGDGPADINHDHTVNIDDLVSVIIAWGMCP